MHKVSGGGSYRLDRKYPNPVGRLAIATGATTRAVFRDIAACCDSLAQRGRLDVLSAVKARQVSLAQVLDANRRDALDELMASLTAPVPVDLSPEDMPLWPAVRAWTGPDKSHPHDSTQRRYSTSCRKLERAGILRADAIVADLGTVDWHAAAKAWNGSAADWNHLRRAIGRFLTVHLGDVFHPLRRTVMKAIPKKREIERVPDLDAITFWKVVEQAPEHLRASYVALVALGLRTGEYLRMREEHLHPITKTVSVPGTKTAGSAAVLRVDADLWPWVVAAVPSPAAHKTLWEHWKSALKAAGADPSIRLHDLRHLTAQLLVNAGQTEASVQSTMRHATPAMTRRYAMQKDRGENAAALARSLLPARTA